MGKIIEDKFDDFYFFSNGGNWYQPKNDFLLKSLDNAFYRKEEVVGSDFFGETLYYNGRVIRTRTKFTIHLN